MTSRLSSRRLRAFTSNGFAAIASVLDNPQKRLPVTKDK
jgi:hypothetical protein